MFELGSLVVLYTTFNICLIGPDLVDRWALILAS